MHIQQPKTAATKLNPTPKRLSLASIRVPGFPASGTEQGSIVTVVGTVCWLQACSCRGSCVRHPSGVKSN